MCRVCVCERERLTVVMIREETIAIGVTVVVTGNGT